MSTRTVGVVLVVIGVVLLIFGIQAADSLASDFSELFTGAPTNKTIWLLIGGLGAALYGMVLLSRRA